MQVSYLHGLVNIPPYGFFAMFDILQIQQIKIHLPTFCIWQVHTTLFSTTLFRVFKAIDESHIFPGLIPALLFLFICANVWGSVILTDCPGLNFHKISIVSGLGIYNYTNESHVTIGCNWYTPYLAWEGENDKLLLKVSHFRPYHPSWNRTRVASALG